MTKQNKASNKLMIYRVATIAVIAFLLVQLNIVSDTMSGSDFGLYIFAAFIALPISMLLDKYIVRFVRTGSLK